MKLSPEDQKKLEQDMVGRICFFCDNTAQAVASIPVDPELYNGQEGLAFPVCLPCMGASETWNTDAIEMAALGKVHRYGWA